MAHSQPTGWKKHSAASRRSRHFGADLSDLVMQGFALQQQEQLGEAQAVYRRVLEKDSRNFDALHMSGLIASRMKNPALAVELIGKAIEVNPNFAPAHSNLGASLKALQRLDEAVASYERAIALAPDTAEAHSNLGNALRELRRPTEALARYDHAIALKPDFADAFYNRGNALNDLKRLDETVASFSRALELNPRCEFLPGLLIHALHRICNWENFTSNNQFLETQLSDRQKASPPFLVCTTLDAPPLQKLAAQVWVQAKCPAKETLGPIQRKSSAGRIRIGYFSADFYDHATSYLMAELFELHDRERFELFAFSFGPDVQDTTQQRVTRAFDHFIDIQRLSDREAASRARECGIDIAVDLKGYTQESRPGIFSYRCAPVQVNYLGYPGTMGAQYMDYMIADKILIPTESQTYYSEKIVYMPHTYQVNDTKRVISDRVFTKSELGLPDTGFVFCCFNNSYKITPDTFDGWTRILKAVEGSVLWLLDDNPSATQNLRNAARERGVDPSRLIFGARMPLSEHLARHRYADLFLDTLPCNAHTTTSDALWAGLPVLTLPGASFAARVAASLLQAIELPELIASSQADYEQLAIELARNSSKLNAIQEKLTRNRLTAPLYNTPLFTRHLESAYLQMHQQNLRGLAPEHIVVQP
jgi:predicted O-linked N-acetylglucosamine transferase (SPINDLY family)